MSSADYANGWREACEAAAAECWRIMRGFVDVGAPNASRGARAAAEAVRALAALGEATPPAPERCPTCNSDNPAILRMPCTICECDPWHDAPASEPAPPAPACVQTQSTRNPDAIPPAPPDEATERLRRAIAAYRADPINANDRPSSWMKLDAMIDAAEAAIDAAEAAIDAMTPPAKEEPR